MRWIARIAGGLVGIVLVFVVLATVAFFAVPTERVAGIVTERISAATGREVVIAGEVSPTLWPALGIRAEGLSVGNPDWVDAGPMLTTESLHVSLDWASLLRGEVRVVEASLNGPHITLVREPDGRASWDFADLAAEPGGEPPPAAPVAVGEPPGTSETQAAEPLPAAVPDIGIAQAEIVDGSLLFIDGASRRTVDVTDLDAVLSLPSMAGIATLEGAATIDGADVRLDMSLDAPSALLEGQVRPASIAMTWNGGRAAFDGRLALSPALEGSFELDISDLGPLMTLVGQPVPDLPQGLGRDRIAASGRLTLTPDNSLHVREGQLTLDATRFAVAADLSPGEERPFIRGTVSADAVDLSALSGAGAPAAPRETPAAAAGAPAPAGSGSSGASGWPRDRIDVSGLFATDAEVALRLGEVDLGAAEMGPVELNATLTRGRLVFDIGQIGLYGGRLAGQFVVNGRGGLSTGGDLNLIGVGLRPLLTRFADFDRLEGSGNASLRFLAVGNDVATLMASLEGEGDLAFGSGAILGFDLAGMIRNFDPSFRGEGQRTVYDSLTANFTVENGVLSNDDLLLDAPWGTVAGEGTTDLGQRTADYRVTPGVMRDEAGGVGIEVPILITGPWASLSFRPDLEYLAEQEFLRERDRLAAEAEARLEAEQDRIEQEVRDRANELLGTDIQAGNPREEIGRALEERLSDEVEGVLQDLLGGN